MEDVELVPLEPVLTQIRVHVSVTPVNITMTATHASQSQLAGLDRNAAAIDVYAFHDTADTLVNVDHAQLVLNLTLENNVFVLHLASMTHKLTHASAVVD